jgi:hypothetical protein
MGKRGKFIDYDNYVENQEQEKILNNLHVDASQFGVKGDRSQDESIYLNKAIEYIMQNGGGTLYVPAGDYELDNTVFTHSDNLTIDQANSPLRIIGATPLYADLYNPVRNITRFIRTTAGTMIGVNYTDTQDAVLGTSVYRNLTIKNIAFYGSGVMDTKYTGTTASTTAINAIEMHRSAITLEDCLFWKVDKGVAQPTIVGSDENYCDQSVYRRLSFRHIGTCWIEAYRSDASTFENLNGYNMAKTCQSGIYARSGESFTIKDVLVAGHSMHLCPSFKLIDLYDAKNVECKNLYTERVEGLVVNMETNCRNITIDGLSVRHYAGTLIKGRTGVRNLTVKNINTKVEEDKKLSPSDTGDFTLYDTIAKPLDIDLDNTCYNIEVDKTFFRHAVHVGSDFNDASFRLVPTTNKTAFHFIGKPYIVNVYHDGTQIQGKCNGVIIDWALMFGIARPTYNATTGLITFESKGVFGNSPSAFVSGRVSGGGKINYPVIDSASPLTIRVLTTTFTNMDAPNVNITLMVAF